MEMLLIREEMWCVIDSARPVPVTDAWEKLDLKARATIGLCVDDSQTSLIRNCASAKEAWDALKKYHDKGSEVYLLKKLTRLELSENGDMEQHLQDFTDLLQRIADTGDGIPAKWQVAILLCSLPESYDPLTTALEQRPIAELTLDLVKSKLLAEAEKRRERAGVASGNSEKALRTDFKKNRGGSASAGSGMETRECFHCKKPGHLKRNCRLLKKGSVDGRKVEEVKQKEEVKVKQASVDSGPLAWMVGHGEPTAWFVDSGASRHMTGDKKFFSTLEETAGVSVMLADGEKAEVSGTGSGSIVGVDGKGNPVDIVLSDVLFVPKLTSGLVSVSTLASKCFDVVFSDNRCEIRNRMGEISALAMRHGSLYKLCTPNQAMVSVHPSHTADCQHTWHRRLGHRDPEVVRMISSKGYAEGMKLVDCGVRTVCSSCMEGKMSRIPFPKHADHEVKEKLDLVHTDLSGPMEETPSGNKYFLTLIDDYTRMTFIYLLRKKSDAAEKVKDFVRFCKTQIGKAPRIIRSDGGGEYVCSDLQDFLRKEGIVSQFTAPYSPQQNGVAERKNRYLKEMTLCMLRDADMEPRYWGEAVLTATYLQNRLPTRSVEVSPFEKWYGKKPNYEHFKIFGCEAWVQIPAEKRKKMEVKARKLVFVGYSNEHKAFRFLDKSSDRITISRDVKFIEKLEMQGEIVLGEQPKSVGEELAKPVPVRPIVNSEEDEEESEEIDREEEGACGGRRVLPRRETRGVVPARLRDYELGLVAVEQFEPATYKEATSCAEKEEWSHAMREELESLMSNNTWELVDPPPGHNVVGCRWVFRKKLNAEGKVERFKARLVAQGYTQKFGSDFTEVFAPVAMQATFRVLLAIAGQRKMIVRHLDVKTAYLYGNLSEEIYMRQPPGFIDHRNSTKVCRLRKSIYGLKQAARVWHQTITAILLELGFSQCKSDSCLYKKLIGTEWMYLLIYVDDILVLCKQEEMINAIEAELQQRVKIVKLGDINYFLGIQVCKDSKGWYSLSQEAFIDRIVERFGMGGAKGSKYPLDPGYFKICNDSKQLKDNFEYHSLIGSLLYLASHSRPDIAVSVGILSRKLSCPTELDWKEAKRILRYLIFTRHYKLKLGGTAEWKLVGYSDADWAGDANDRKSCSGFLFGLGGATVSWTSRKQTCVTMSTMEAEYVALSEAAQEAVWLRGLLKELNEEQTKPTVIFEDNRSCLDFAVLDQQRKRSKHVDTRYHYTRELVTQKQIELRYCPTDEMLADVLTKPLGSTKVRKFATEMGLTEDGLQG